MPAGFFGFGPAELLLVLLLSAGGNTPDAVSIFPMRDYFKLRGIEPTQAKLLELASTDPATAKAQIMQLQALRLLAEDPKLEADALRVIRAIAAGEKAKDKHGFAQRYAQKVLARAEGKGEPPAGKGNPLEGLEWFPERATIAGVIDFRAARIPGVPPPPPEPAIWKFLPEKVKREVLTKAFEILESTGNIELHRGSFAVAEGDKLFEDPRIYARFSGKFNQEWIVETLKKQTSLKIETGNGPSGEKFHYTEVERDQLALALMNDSEFLLAGIPFRGQKGLPLIEEMLQIKAKKKESVLKGKKTKDLIAKVPPGALGLFVMEVPDDLKKLIAGGGGPDIRPPEKVVLFVTPAIKAVDIQLELSMVNEEDAKVTIKEIFALRAQGIKELKMAEGKIGFPTRPIIDLLESLQVSGKGSTVNMRLLVPEDLIRNTVDQLMRLIPAELEPPPPPKDEKKGAAERPVRPAA